MAKHIANTSRAIAHGLLRFFGVRHLTKFELGHFQEAGGGVGEKW